MGSGCSGSSRGAARRVAPDRSAVSSGPNLTGEQWCDVGRYARGASFAGDDWWWGHARSSTAPPEVKPRVKAMTAPLPPYYRDLLRLNACPSHLDSLCWGAKGKCPFMGGTAYVFHDEVSRLLAECPRELVAGRIERKSELAYLVLSNKAFARSGCLTLANPLAKHRLQRGWVDTLLQGMPGLSGLKKEAHDFLSERTALKFPEDASRWWTELLWRHILQHQLSPAEVDAFNDFRDRWSQAAALHVADLSVAHLEFTMDDINRQQNSYCAKIQALLPKSVPADQAEDVAQAVLEMLSFAGGLSVPQTITACIAALYQDFMREPVTPETVLPFVYEVTRVFPPVNGFAYWRDGHRHILSLSAALLDPAVWGERADKFTLKEVSLYESKHVGFADPAVADHPDDSRACPGRQIALNAAQAFVLAIGAWAPQGQRLESIWRPKGLIEAGGVSSWWKPFQLERLPMKEASWLGELLDRDEEDNTVKKSMQSVGSVQLQAMLSRIDSNLDGVPDVLRKMDGATRIFCAAAKLTWVDQSGMNEIDLPRGPPIGSFTSKNSRELDFGHGIRLPTSDEQWAGMSWSKELGMTLFKRLTSFMGDDISDAHRVATEEQALEAALIGMQAFAKQDGGSYLPPSIGPWSDLESDHAQALIATFGPGQLFLRMNSDPSLLEYGEFVCDASSLGSIPVRPAFERLGAAAFFKRDSSGLFNLTAIDWKHGGRLVTPADADAWEHAKFVWRGSIVSTMTLVHHLTWTHWIASNAVASSIREALGPQHPIRRVLHVNVYNTASVNYTSYWTLYPKNGFLHHMCPFTYEGLQSVFREACGQYTFKTWPQVYAESDVPEEVKNSLPIFEDGLPVWSALHEFYTGYIDLYYASDGALRSDEELRAYWRFQCVPPYAKHLPPLSKAALAEQLTQVVFDVTAYHELVGHVISLVSDPRGCFMQIRPGANMADQQHLVQVMSLCASTGSPMPRFLDDWSRLLDLGRNAPQNHFTEAQALCVKLRDRLLAISAEIQLRNAGRPQPFCQFDPQYYETSVSL